MSLTGSFVKLKSEGASPPRFTSLSGDCGPSGLRSSGPAWSGLFFAHGTTLTYTCKMLWIKTLHIVLVASWFAGLFYLPRIFVNLAMVEPDSVAERQRLLLMARKLLRFINILVGPALVLGLVLWLYYGIGMGPGHPWMHAKLLFVAMALGYHHWCGRILRQIEAGNQTRSHLWYRGFNEWPVLIMLITVALVVIKPADLGEFFLHMALPIAALIALAWVTIRAKRR